MGRPSKLHEVRGRWRCRIGGKPYSWATRAEAEAEFHILMGQHLAAKLNPDRPHTVAGVVTQWRVLHPSYDHWVLPFLEFGGRLHVLDVQRDTLTRYLIHLKSQSKKRRTFNAKTKKWAVQSSGQPFATKTIRHYLATAKSVLEWAHRQGWTKTVPENPKVPRPVREARDVEPAKLAAVLADLPKRAGRILRFIAATGCRPGEACDLDWSQVHLASDLCVLSGHKTADKTGRPRTIYLTPEASSILRDLLPDIGTPTGPVFRSRLGTTYTPAGLRAILRRHGNITPYQLRHSFAQEALNDLPMEVVAKLLGHSDLATVQTYCQIRDRRAASAAATIKPKLAKIG